jgi:hypothetical protein
MYIMYIYCSKIMLSYIYAQTTRQTTKRDRPSFRKYEAKTHESLIQMIRSPGRRKGRQKAKDQGKPFRSEKVRREEGMGKGRQVVVQAGREESSQPGKEHTEGSLVAVRQARRKPGRQSGRQRGNQTDREAGNEESKQAGREERREEER